MNKMSEVITSATQSSNYCTRLNRVARAQMQRWTVTAVYADSLLNVRYQYRTARGAEQQVAYLRRLIAVDANRVMGNEIAMVDIQVVSHV